MDLKGLGTNSGKFLYGCRGRFRGLPVINKIDLPQAEPDRVKNEIEEMVGLMLQNLL
ncbi:MAG: hypothetical protein Ct9H90mP22_3360 [Gammaproteobacteria bacterium]|nr:MAG: hypothetical protein Ct9H90mP22_3360 [Gammaproteobacteria bacterium]